MPRSQSVLTVTVEAWRRYGGYMRSDSYLSDTTSVAADTRTRPAVRSRPMAAIDARSRESALCRGELRHCSGVLDVLVVLVIAAKIAAVGRSMERERMEVRVRRVRCCHSEN